MAKQIASCDAKILIGTVDSNSVLQEALNLLPSPIPLVSIRTKTEQTIPNGSIDFAQLMDTSGKYRAILTLEFSPILTKYAFVPRVQKAYNFRT